LIFDIESVISRDKLEEISRLLNEKLSGLSLKEIRDTFVDRIGDMKNENTGIIKIFIDSINKIFQEEQEGVSLYIGGTIEILSQPEFVNTDKYRDLIQLTSDRNIVCHVLNSVPENESGISILIGNENKDEKLKDYSIISSTYTTGDVTGKIAIIGPKRMNYSKMVSFLNYTSKIIAEKF
jgi:heat-inducible transcriptional repressor